MRIVKNMLKWAPFCLVALLALAAFAFIANARSSGETRSWKTHAVARGDLVVRVIERGAIESSENTRIICRVRGENSVTWVIDNGTEVKAGDELVRLDTLLIEETIFEKTKYAHWSKAGSLTLGNMVRRSSLAIPEYEQGRFQVELMKLQKDLALAESDLRTAQNILDYVQAMYERGYRSELQVAEQTLDVERLKADLEVKETDIDVLKNFTRREELEKLQGEYNKWDAKHKGQVEQAKENASRRDRAIEELANCVVKAPRDGLVIYPRAEKWKEEPDIRVGGSVHKNQVLLLMPNLSKMQVKIGIHESVIDRIAPGTAAVVSLPDKDLDAEVTFVALITKPAGWWAGNSVKYDTVIELPGGEDLKPGMTAEVEVIIARHEAVLKVPTTAVLETTEGDYCCWIDTADGPRRRALALGDSSEDFIVLHDGLEEGDQVIINPLAFIEEAQHEALKVWGRKEEQGQESPSGGVQKETTRARSGEQALGAR